MVTIFGWDVFRLPPALTGLGPWLLLAGALLFRLAAAGLLRLAAHAGLHWLTRHTESDVDDVIIYASSGPLVALVLLLGAYDAVLRMGRVVQPMRLTEQVLILAVIAVVTYWVWRLFKNVLIDYSRRLREGHIELPMAQPVISMRPPLTRPPSA